MYDDHRIIDNTIIAVLGVIIIIFGMLLAIWTVGASKHKPLRPSTEIIFPEDAAWEAQQTRLHQKHGTGRVIIYTAAETYFHDDLGRKCNFK
ncbi:hypothetical protein M0R72_13945 [Candidatus Pacearchaeota archaeon]|jgi:hypothetical protein|nr:hypothetical protein [Candidatus Pacearchaeota archaeon]